MDNEVKAVVVLLAAGSLAACLIACLILLTIGFKKVKEVERYLSIPDDWIGHFMGQGLWGRVIRSAHISGYFLFRLIPRMRPRMERQFGREVEPIPLHLKLWATLPCLLSMFFFGLFMLPYLLGAYDP